MKPVKKDLRKKSLLWIYLLEKKNLLELEIPRNNGISSSAAVSETE